MFLQVLMGSIKHFAWRIFKEMPEMSTCGDLMNSNECMFVFVCCALKTKPNVIRPNGFRWFWIFGSNTANVCVKYRWQVTWSLVCNPHYMFYICSNGFWWFWIFGSNIANVHVKYCWQVTWFWSVTACVVLQTWS